MTGAGQPRSSTTGRQRESFRKSTRHSNRSQSGADNEKLQVVLDGVDRTPKPLLSLNPTALRGGGQGDTTTPNSETSEFFMDRMSTGAFGKSGWYSNADSGQHTPKSEAEYDYETEKRDRERKAATDAAAAAAMGDDGASDSARGAPREEEPPAPPALLSERDLERPVYLQLQETETIFIMQTPGVTVALDTEEAKAVEEANKRYVNLLATKQATDKYVDAEAQTLVALKKSRDVQSAVLATRGVCVQATAWDIADTFRALDEASAEADEDPRGGAQLPSISAMAGSVTKYQGAASRQGPGGAGGATDRSRGTSVAASMIRPSGFGGQSMYGGGGASFATVRPDGLSGLSAGGLPAGVPMEGTGGPPVQQADPLHSLPGLGEALLTMDYAINQNNYLQQLLLYRDIQVLPSLRATVANAMRGAAAGGGDDDTNSDAMSHTGRDARPASAAPSDGGRSHVAESVAGRSERAAPAPLAAGPMPRSSLSRQASERSVLQRALSMRDGHSVADGRAGRASHGGGGMGVPGYAASVAESNWPEELLQELADLGDDAPRMEHLWDWSCPLTAGKNVACMGWNKANPDLLAVGYGSCSFASGAPPAHPAHASPPAQPAQGSPGSSPSPSASPGGAAADAAAAPPGSTARGLVAFWSLKNLAHPVWWFEAKAAVTALDFSTYSPNLLAVGLYDGTVAIYDTKSRQGSPSLESDVHSGKHADPVWKVRWLDRGPERDEPLVSISTDGRVTQWSIAKGLEYSDLMKLKRMARRGTGPMPAAAAASSEQQDAFISRLTSGMAFDFSPADERIYVAATEDGWLHRCSTSYNEQYLESYRGHMGPVYAVQFSPYRRDMFLSASGDWTVRMWQEGREAPLLTFQAGSTEVHDCQWCPSNSTVFGSVTAGGRLEIWDFSLSTVKPCMHVKVPCKLSCLLFAPGCPVVVCGGEDGSVRAYRLFNVAHEYDSAGEQSERLEECIRANVMKSTPSQPV